MPTLLECKSDTKHAFSYNIVEILNEITGFMTREGAIKAEEEKKSKLERKLLKQ